MATVALLLGVFGLSGPCFMDFCESGARTGKDGLVIAFHSVRLPYIIESIQRCQLVGSIVTGLLIAGCAGFVASNLFGDGVQLRFSAVTGVGVLSTST